MYNSASKSYILIAGGGGGGGGNAGTNSSNAGNASSGCAGDPSTNSSGGGGGGGGVCIGDITYEGTSVHLPHKQSLAGIYAKGGSGASSENTCDSQEDGSDGKVIVTFSQFSYLTGLALS